MPWSLLTRQTDRQAEHVILSLSLVQRSTNISWFGTSPLHLCYGRIGVQICIPAPNIYTYCVAQVQRKKSDLPLSLTVIEVSSQSHSCRKAGGCFSDSLQVNSFLFWDFHYPSSFPTVWYSSPEACHWNLSFFLSETDILKLNLKLKQHLRDFFFPVCNDSSSLRH